LLFDESLQNLGRTICCVITGGNISQELLKQVVQGQLSKEGASIV